MPSTASPQHRARSEKESELLQEERHVEPEKAKEWQGPPDEEGQHIIKRKSELAREQPSAQKGGESYDPRPGVKHPALSILDVVPPTLPEKQIRTTWKLPQVAVKAIVIK